MNTTRRSYRRLSNARLVSILIAYTAFLAPSYEPSATSWQVFESKAGRFKVQMPGTPKSTQTHTSSFIGDVTNHLFITKDGDRSFSVDYSDLPHLAVSFAGSDTIYSHAKGALLKKTLSKEQNYEDVTIQGIRGKKLLYEMPPMRGHPKMHGQAYLLLDRNRLYVFDVQSPLGRGEAAAQRFLSSIGISRP